MSEQDRYDKLTESANEVICHALDLEEENRKLRQRLAAPPAPPVATTGAVPSEVRDAIKRIWEHHNPCFVVTSYEPNSKGRRAREDDFDTVGSWLSAAPAPKAEFRDAAPLEPLLLSLAEGRISVSKAMQEVVAWSEGLPISPYEPPQGSREDGLVMAAPKASEVEREEHVPWCNNQMGKRGEPGCICLKAQPHARAEGATEEVGAALKFFVGIANSVAVGNFPIVGKADARHHEEVLRRALSGSAEGRP